MNRRSKRNLHNVRDYTTSLDTKPSFYNILIFNISKISKSIFVDILEKCLNCDNTKADLLYSELVSNNHIKYGVYTKDVAETVALRIRSISTDQTCCIIKN